MEIETIFNLHKFYPYPYRRNFRLLKMEIETLTDLNFLFVVMAL